MKRTSFLTVSAFALLGILSLSVVASSAGPGGAHPPSMSVQVTSHSITTGATNGFDTIITVSVPHQSPSNPPTYDLTQVFLVQQINVTETGPGITDTSPNTLITCTNAASPAYPSRFMPVTCTGIFSYRVNPEVYPGTSTGIYWVGFTAFDLPGTYTFTYTVTGLYNSAPVTLSQTFSVQVH